MAWSTKRTVVGCAIGCGVLVVAAVAIAVGFGLWLRAPGALLEPERLLGEDTTGYVELRLTLDDPETAAFVERIILGLQSIAADNVGALPAPIGGWIQSARETKTRSDIQKLFPAVAAWTLRSDDGEDVHLFSVSLEQASHQLILADYMLGLFIGRDEHSSKHRHGGETIYRIDADGTSFTAFIANGIVFVTTGLDSAKRAVDAMNRPPQTPPEATRLDRLFDGVPRDRPLRGAVTNESGEVERLWTRLAADGGESIDATRWNELQGVALSGELDADGAFVGFVDVVLPGTLDDTDSEFWSSAFRAAVPEDNARIEIDPQSLGGRIRLALRVPRLMESLIPDELGDRSGDAASEPAPRITAGSE